MKHKQPILQVWNLTFTMISFVCALTMTHEYFDSLLNKGPYGKQLVSPRFFKGLVTVAD